MKSQKNNVITSARNFSTVVAVMSFVFMYLERVTFVSEFYHKYTFVKEIVDVTVAFSTLFAVIFWLLYIYQFLLKTYFDETAPELLNLTQTINLNTEESLKKIDSLQSQFKESFCKQDTIIKNIDNFSQSTAQIIQPSRVDDFTATFQNATKILAFNPPLDLLKNTSHKMVIINSLLNDNFSYEMIVGNGSY